MKHIVISEEEIKSNLNQINVLKNKIKNQKLQLEKEINILKKEKNILRIIPCREYPEYEGIQKNISLQDLKDENWETVFMEPFNECDTKLLKSIFSEFREVKENIYCIGSIKYGIIKLCAFGDSNIFKETKRNETNYQNNVYWYLKEYKSFGFSSNKIIELNECDIYDKNDTNRMSWEYV